ncbi:MAG: DUF4476 domain-containing protein [Chitinophagaceae bacterium]
MKKISTLGLGILISMASFAGYAPNRLIVAAEGNSNIKVTVDGSRFDQQSFSNSAVFENLQPGFHAVKVYQLSEKRSGMFGRKRADEYRLVYTASVNIKPLFATTIQLNRFGKAQIIERPMPVRTGPGGRGGSDNRGWGKDDRRNDDRGYNGNDNNSTNDRDYNNNDRDKRSNDYSSNSGYNRIISNQDFFAAQRVMERENFDDARLLYAKRLADENYLSAEQVKELARFFSFDNSRLEFAKYAYSKTTDRNNYSVVCNAFSSSYGKEQLMHFISNGR